MTDEFMRYEKACAAIRNENVRLLDEFAEWLRSKGLAPATIEKHVSNIDFYVNDFLLYYEPTQAKDGLDKVGMFLGDWFIRKAMWATQTSMRSLAASLKKFYQFMVDQDLVLRTALADFKSMIKEELPDWLETLRRYDDPTIEDSVEVWGF